MIRYTVQYATVSRCEWSVVVNGIQVAGDFCIAWQYQRASMTANNQDRV
jgi:hypothetical protein